MSPFTPSGQETDWAYSITRQTERHRHCTLCGRA